MADNTNQNTLLQQMLVYIQEMLSNNPGMAQEKLEKAIKNLTNEEQQDILRQLLEDLKIYIGSGNIKEIDMSNLEKEIDLNFYSDINNNELIDKWETNYGTWNKSLNEIFNALKIFKDPSGYQFLNGEVSFSELQDADAAHSFSSPYRNIVYPNKNIDGNLYSKGGDESEDLNNTEEALSDIRKTKTTSHITDDKNLQFTRQKVENPITAWLRLIMPQFTRRVIVEDLNRNFWVLGTVIDCMYDWIFGDESPWNKVFNGLLTEIIGLWENILYMFVFLEMLLNESTGKIKVISLPLPNSNCQTQVKYDFLEEDINKLLANNGQEIINRVNYLTEQYFDTNLIIIPHIRVHNYKHNYYDTQVFPGVVFWNTCYKTKKFVRFLSRIGTLWSNKNGASYNREAIEKTPGLCDCSDEFVHFSPSLFARHLYGMRETDWNYEYTFPLSSVSQKFLYHLDENEHKVPDRTNYYGALRIEFKITPFLDKNKKICFKDFHLEAYDAIGQSILEKEYSLTHGSTYYYEWINKYDTVFDMGNERDNAEFSDQVICSYGSFEDEEHFLYYDGAMWGEYINNQQACYSEEEQGNFCLGYRVNNRVLFDMNEKIYPFTQDISSTILNSAYYLGDLPSYAVLTSDVEINYNVIVNNIIGSAYMIRIGSIYSADYEQYMESDKDTLNIGSSNNDIWTGHSGLETTGENTKRSQPPTNYIWSLLTKTPPSNNSKLYQPQTVKITRSIDIDGTPQNYDIYSVRYGKSYDLSQVSYSTIQDISQEVIIDFIKNNYHFKQSFPGTAAMTSENVGYQNYTDDTRLYIEFNNGIADDPETGEILTDGSINFKKREDVQISYFIGVLGVNNVGNPVYSWSKGAILTDLYRYIPQQLADTINTNTATPITINDQIIGYIQRIGKINYSIDPNYYSGNKQYIRSGLHLQGLIGSPNVMSYIRVQVLQGDEYITDWYVDVSQFSPNIKQQYDNAEDQAQFLVNYIKAGNTIGVITDRAFKKEFNKPEVRWTIYDGKVEDPTGNIDRFRPISSGYGDDYRQIVSANLRINEYGIEPLYDKDNNMMVFARYLPNNNAVNSEEYRVNQITGDSSKMRLYSDDSDARDIRNVKNTIFSTYLTLRNEQNRYSGSGNKVI